MCCQLKDTASNLRECTCAFWAAEWKIKWAKNQILATALGQRMIPGMYANKGSVAVVHGPGPGREHSTGRQASFLDRDTPGVGHRFSNKEWSTCAHVEDDVTVGELACFHVRATQQLAS